MPNDVDLTFSVGDTTQWSIISIEQDNQNWWHQVYVVCYVTPSYLLQSTLEYKCLRNLYSSCRPKHIKSYVEFYTSSSKSCLSFWVNPTKPNKWFGKAFLSMLLQLLGTLTRKEAHRTTIYDDVLSIYNNTWGNELLYHRDNTRIGISKRLMWTYESWLGCLLIMSCYGFTRSTQESLPNSLVQVLGEFIWLVGIVWKGFLYTSLYYKTIQVSLV